MGNVLPYGNKIVRGSTRGRLVSVSHTTSIFTRSTRLLNMTNKCYFIFIFNYEFIFKVNVSTILLFYWKEPVT